MVDTPVTDPTRSRARLLRPSQVAERTGFAIGTIRRWANEGKFRGAVRSPGGRILVPTDSVDEVLTPIKEAADETSD